MINKKKIGGTKERIFLDIYLYNHIYAIGYFVNTLYELLIMRCAYDKGN